ncbi:MAG: preprotein translocase subunit SecG [Bacteroidota bacterium]|nr:preprotein translocase subunit SecG [Bacteroidota bacterium]
MFTFLCIILIIIALILILAVLIQNPKGGGIAANFNFPQQIVGVQRTSDLIEKITWGVAIGIFIICLGTSFSKPDQSQGFDNKVKDALESMPTPPDAQPPAAPAK